MKKFIILVLFIFIAFPAYAENIIETSPQTNNNSSTIKPQLLTSKETQNYILVNDTACKAFSNVNLKINTDSFPSNISELKSPPPYDDLSLFYITKKDGKYAYRFDKDTGHLIEIELAQSNINEKYPNTTFLYSYPAGNLISVTVNASSTEFFSFNPNGYYIDFKDYMSKLQKAMKRNWTAQLRSVPIIPVYKFNDSLNTKINFKVNKNGELIAYRINKPSGNSSFDYLAINCLKESLPAYKLPDAFNQDSIEVNFNFEFNVIGKNTKDKDYEQIRQNKINLPEVKLNNFIREYGSISNDKLIWLSLDLIKNSKYSSIIDSLLCNNQSKKPIEIYFKDLSKYGTVYVNFDGIGWKDKKTNNLYIFINEKHIDAPPEAIACLIARLEVHQDEQDSINEEIYSTTREGELWADFTKHKPEITFIPNSLVSRENKLLEKYKEGNNTNKYIKEMIYSHSFYKTLPQSSPGF